MKNIKRALDILEDLLNENETTLTIEECNNILESAKKETETNRLYMFNNVIEISDEYDLNELVSYILNNNPDRKTVISDLMDVKDFPAYCSLWELEVFEREHLKISDNVIKFKELYV